MARKKRDDSEDGEVCTIGTMPSNHPEVPSEAEYFAAEGIYPDATWGPSGETYAPYTGGPVGENGEWEGVLERDGAATGFLGSDGQVWRKNCGMGERTALWNQVRELVKLAVAQPPSEESPEYAHASNAVELLNLVKKALEWSPKSEHNIERHRRLRDKVDDALGFAGGFNLFDSKDV